MYGNEEQIRLDAARFNQLYQIGNVLTDSANGILYHLYRKSDNFHCVLKVCATLQNSVQALSIM